MSQELGFVIHLHHYFTSDLYLTIQHFAIPTAEEKRAFTRVLQGHIAIDTAVFPTGTTGYNMCVTALFSDQIAKIY